MSNGATGLNKAANQNYTNWEQGALNGYNSDIGSYMSNVNSQLAAGNPFQSKAYLTQQNIATSGAMNSANTAGATAIRDTAARTGQNSAATTATIASNARAGQRDLTQYNAERDTANENSWLNDQNELTKDQLAGANSEAGIYGTSVSGNSNALGNLTQEQDAEDQMWGSMVGGLAGGAGSAIGGVFQGKG